MEERVQLGRDGRVGVPHAAEEKYLESVEARETLELNQPRRKAPVHFANREIDLEKNRVRRFAGHLQARGNGRFRVARKLWRAHLRDDCLGRSRDLARKLRC